MKKFAEKNAIIEVMNRHKITMAKVNKAMNWTSSGFAQLMSRGTMTVETFVKIMDAMDYEVTIQPRKTSGTRTEGQIVIADQDDETVEYWKSRKEKN